MDLNLHTFDVSLRVTIFYTFGGWVGGGESISVITDINQSNLPHFPTESRISPTFQETFSPFQNNPIIFFGAGVTGD